MLLGERTLIVVGKRTLLVGKIQWLWRSRFAPLRNIGSETVASVDSNRGTLASTAEGSRATVIISAEGRVGLVS